MSRTIAIVHVNMKVDFPITYNNASMLCKWGGTYLHQTVNLVVFFLK